MSIKKWVAGEEITADGLNAIRNIIAGSYNAGETIAGATLPVPVYQNTTDNEFYACDADVITRLNFVGFAITDSTDGNPMDIQFNGIVKGFTALAEGEKYYVQDAVGTIGTTKGTYNVLVGRAISETELLILHEEKPVFTNGTTTKDISNASNTQNIAHSLGRIPKKIRLFFDIQVINASSPNGRAILVYNGTTSSVVGHEVVSGNIVTLNSSGNIKLINSAAIGSYLIGVITFDITNIIITWTNTDSAASQVWDILWEAEA